MATRTSRRPPPKVGLPILREGGVERAQLVGRLLSSADSRLVSVVAPGGYGKTTVLAQWAEADPRPVAWLTLDPGDDDPFRLVADLGAALGRAGLVEQAPRVSDRRTATAIWARLVPSLRSTLAAVEEPFVLVIDDAHRLTTMETLDVLAALAQAIPPGSQLALCGRTELTAVVAPTRARLDLLELDASHLALSTEEAGELLAETGILLEEAEVEELNRRAEGWAAGIVLTGLALRTTGAVHAPGPGDVDRFVEDYLRTEHLSDVSKAMLDFLTQTAVLDRLSGPLCDAVLERSGSQAMLEAIERESRFLLALDLERRWFRYHELFRSVLLRSLERTDPGAADALRERAAAWCSANDRPVEAMRYARAAGGLEAAASIFVAHAIPLYRSGQLHVLAQWLDDFDDPAVLGRFPAVAALGALGHAFLGETFQAERWLDAAVWALERAGSPGDGPSETEPLVAFGEAMLCRHGPLRMAQDAERARQTGGPLWPLHAAALWLQGTALRLQGDVPRAVALLEQGAGLGETSGASPASIAALSELAALALDAGDLAEARDHVDRAQRLGPSDRDGYQASTLLAAVRAHLAARTDDPDAARRSLAAVQQARPLLTSAVPFVGVRALSECARAYLALGEAGGARAVLVDASDILRRRPDLGVLADEVRVLREAASRSQEPRDGWESSLTTAELRLLPLLTTHLTFRAIGERLYVSRNTVKTQAISIYRKLGASSRAEAVSKASELGLLHAGLVSAAGSPRADDVGATTGTSNSS